jgi:predicted transcriptional regulator
MDRNELFVTATLPNEQDTCCENTDVSGVKRGLLSLVCKFLGIRYHELAKFMRLSHGVLSHHLTYLEKARYVQVDRRTGTTRYYPLTVSNQDFALIGALRSEPVRKIIQLILEKECCTFKEIVSAQRNLHLQYQSS